MALIVPEFLQTKKYSAKRDRLMFAHGGPLQAGVWDPNDFKVVQRAAGAAMAVDVGAGYALVNASNTGNAGLYHVQNDATVTVAIPTADGTNPRLDQVGVLVNDSTDGGVASDDPQFFVVQGTATAGATLDNRSGASLPPANWLRVADVLVGAGVTSITSSNIRDRRPWARGLRYYAPVSAVSSSAQVEIPTSVFRWEHASGGRPMVLTFAGQIFSTVANGKVRIDQRYGGGVVANHDFYLPQANLSYDFTIAMPYDVSAGSRAASLGIGNGGTTGTAGLAGYCYLQAVEDPRPSAAN